MSGADLVKLQLPRAHAEQLARLLAETVMDERGDPVIASSGWLGETDADALGALRLVWRRLRLALERQPHEWPESEGQIPAWARHR